MLNGLDLFSGIGGISIALKPWVRTVAYCEQDRFAQGVLLSRMQSGDLDRAPIWDDVRTLRGELVSGIDIIFGGFPCQDISVAGNGRGLGGERSGLFFEVLRLAEEIKPKFIFLENVPAIRTRGLNIVAESLASIGYDCRWDIISASEVGAPHIRKRWFLLAYANGSSLRKQQRRTKWKGRPRSIQPSKNVEYGLDSNSDSISKGIRQSEERHKDNFPLWIMESDNWDYNAEFFLRVDNGLSHRSHQVKCLGNSVVPKQAKIAFMKLIGSPSTIATKDEK